MSIRAVTDTISSKKFSIFVTSKYIVLDIFRFLDINSFQLCFFLTMRITDSTSSNIFFFVLFFFPLTLIYVSSWYFFHWRASSSTWMLFLFSCIFLVSFYKLLVSLSSRGSSIPCIIMSSSNSSCQISSSLLQLFFIIQFFRIIYDVFLFHGPINSTRHDFWSSYFKNFSFNIDIVIFDLFFLPPWTSSGRHLTSLHRESRHLTLPFARQLTMFFRLLDFQKFLDWPHRRWMMFFSFLCPHTHNFFFPFNWRLARHLTIFIHDGCASVVIWSSLTQHPNLLFFFLTSYVLPDWSHPWLTLWHFWNVPWPLPCADTLPASFFYVVFHIHWPYPVSGWSRWSGWSKLVRLIRLVRLVLLVRLVRLVRVVWVVPLVQVVRLVREVRLVWRHSLDQGGMVDMPPTRPRCGSMQERLHRATTDAKFDGIVRLIVPIPRCLAHWSQDLWPARTCMWRESGTIPSCASWSRRAYVGCTKRTEEVVVSWCLAGDLLIRVRIWAERAWPYRLGGSFFGCVDFSTSASSPTSTLHWSLVRQDYCVEIRSHDDDIKFLRATGILVCQRLQEPVHFMRPFAFIPEWWRTRHLRDCCMTVRGPQQKQHITLDPNVVAVRTFLQKLSWEFMEGMIWPDSGASESSASARIIVNLHGAATSVANAQGGCVPDITTTTGSNSRVAHSLASVWRLWAAVRFTLKYQIL